MSRNYTNPKAFLTPDREDLELETSLIPPRSGDAICRDSDRNEIDRFPTRDRPKLTHFACKFIHQKRFGMRTTSRSFRGLKLSLQTNLMSLARSQSALQFAVCRECSIDNKTVSVLRENK